MKKILFTLCVVFSCIMCNTNLIKAESYHYEEVIEIIEESNLRSISTKTAKKTGTFTNSSGAKLWSVTVIGTFTYNGSTSSCTKSDVSASAYSTSWKIYSKSSSKNGNIASATAIVKCYLDGSVISTGTKTVSLKCSANGTLS